MHRKAMVAYLLFSMAVLWLWPSSSRAIPAFAREHRLSCSMCHSPFPRLNEYGRDFAANAFKPGKYDEHNSKTFKDLGDDNLFLLKNFPLAARTEMFFDFASGNDGSSDDFKVPWALRLLSGGDLGHDIGYYLSFFVGQMDQVMGLEQAVLKFGKIFGSPIDIMVGQFQIPTAPFRHNLRPTFQDYLMYKAQPGKSMTRLSYDRGIAISSALDCGLRLTATISNGAGTGGENFEGNFDPDKFKHFSLRASQVLGPVRIGLFGYYGKEELERASDGKKWNNELNAWGTDISLGLGKAELNLQYIQRRDIKPTYATIRETSPVFTQGLIAQAVANILNDPAQMQVVLLFNYVDSDDPKIRQEAYSANVSFLLLTNVKLMAEYTFARIRYGLELNEHRVTLGVVAGI